MKRFMKSIIWLLVAILVVLFVEKCGYPTLKAGWEKPHSDVADGFAVSEANQDTIKTGVRDLQGREPQKTYYGGGKTIIRETVVREVPASRQPIEQVYYPEQPQQTASADQSRQIQPRSGEITPGTMAGPSQFKFCIDLELDKRNDDEKKFLFWELVNNKGYSIPNIVTNGKGPANMILRPGESVDGISYDGSILRISKSSMGRWYSEIFGIPMPTSFRPGIRSDLSGWGYASKPMNSSGNDFVYRF